MASRPPDPPPSPRASATGIPVVADPAQPPGTVTLRSGEHAVHAVNVAFVPVDPPGPSSMFVFGRHPSHQCPCGANLENAYVEVPATVTKSARERMFELREGHWSHEVGDSFVEEIRSTHTRIAGNGPESGRCFCGAKLLEEVAAQLQHVCPYQSRREPRTLILHDHLDWWLLMVDPNIRMRVDYCPFCGTKLD